MLSGVIVLCSSFLLAWLVGLFLPLQEFKVADAFVLGAGILVLHSSPRGVNLCLFLGAIAYSPATKALLASLISRIAMRFG